MDFHLSLSSIIITELFLSFFLSILPPSYCQEDDPRFVVCNSTYACGSVNISFPFWGGGRPEYCGHPGHELSCPETDDEYPVMRFEGLDFRVLNIDTSYLTFTISRLDLLDGPCPPPPELRNTTLNYTLFHYASTDRNLTILYGCPDVQYNNIPELRNRFNCSQGAPDAKFNAYYLEDESPPGVELHARLRRDCGNNIQVPILRNTSAIALLDDPQGGGPAVEKAMVEGFQVEYNNGLGILCKGCEDSGGVCGGCNSTGSFFCFCREALDQRQSNYTCPSPMKVF